MSSSKPFQDGNAYKFFWNETYGRHLVAARDIYPGETVIVESPIVFGPGLSPLVFEGILTVCVGCCANLQNDWNISCDMCHVPLCADSCHGRRRHESLECKVLQKISNLESLLTHGKNPSLTASLSQSIILVRTLIFFAKDRLKREQILALDSKWLTLEKEDFFSGFADLINLLSWNMIEDQASSDVLKYDIRTISKHCLGIMRINAYSNFTSSQSIEGLYFFTSFVTHSCKMNTDRYVDEEGKLTVKAALKVKTGEPFTTSYLCYMNDLIDRQKEALSVWHFRCHCERCERPTEADNNLSSIGCPICSQLVFYPQLNVDNTITWKCKACGYTYESPSLDEAKLLRSLDPVSLETELLHGKEIEELEECLQKSNCRVPENHASRVKVKLLLIRLYGKDNLEELCKQRLLQKYKFCEDLRAVYNSVLGTDSVHLIKGIILFELWCTIQEISRRGNLPYSEDHDLSLAHDRHSLSSADAIKSEACRILKNSVVNSEEELLYNILLEY